MNKTVSIADGFCCGTLCVRIGTSYLISYVKTRGEFTEVIKCGKVAPD